MGNSGEQKILMKHMTWSLGAGAALLAANAALADTPAFILCPNHLYTDEIALRTGSESVVKATSDQVLTYRTGDQAPCPRSGDYVPFESKAKKSK